MSATAMENDAMTSQALITDEAKFLDALSEAFNNLLEQESTWPDAENRRMMREEAIACIANLRKRGVLS